MWRPYHPGTQAFTQGPELRKSLHLASYSAVIILKFLIIFEQGAYIFILFKAVEMMQPVLMANKINIVPGLMIRQHINKQIRIWKEKSVSDKGYEHLGDNLNLVVKESL